MKKNSLGKILKKERIRSGLSVEEVSEYLIKKGHKATPSSIYNWENDISQPKPGILLHMCRAYGIKDVLKTFGYASEKEDGFSFTPEEQTIIEKYRSLDVYGSRAVNGLLDTEYERCLTSVAHAQDKVRPIRFYQRTASAGPGQILFDDLPDDWIEIPDIEDYRRVVYAVGVNGNSMEPLFYDEDILLIEPTTDLLTGEIGIFYVDGSSYVKKLGRGELISSNPAYAPIPLNESSRCMGRVLGKL